MPEQKSAQKPNDWESFHDFQSAKIENFQQVGHFFHSFINYYTFLSKIAKNLMPGQNLLPKNLMPGPAHLYLLLLGSRPPPPLSRLIPSGTKVRGRGQLTYFLGG